MQKFLRTLMLMAVMLLPFASHAQTCTGLTFPYAENFDAYTGNATSTSAPTGYPSITLPECWSFLNMSESTSSYPQAFLTSSTSYAVSGNCLFFKSSSTTPLYAIMPDFGAQTGAWLLSFAYRNEGTTAYNGTIIVGVMSDPTDASTFVGLDTLERTTTKTAVELIIPAGSVTAGGRVVFCYQGGSSNNYYAAIDDVTLDAPSCFPVSNLLVSDATVNSITLTWSDAINTGAQYSVFDMSGVNPAVIATLVSGTTYTVTGLDGNTVYHLGVAANCSETAASTITEITARTACPATASLPYVEEFNGYSGFPTYPYYGPAVLPACWYYYANGTNTAETSGTSVYYGGVACYNGTSYGSMEANNPYLYLPIQLTSDAVTGSTGLGYATARGDIRIAVMPAFATALTGLQISFDYKMSTAYSATGAAATLDFGYVYGDDMTFVSMQSYQAVTTTQNVVDLNLSTLAAAAPAGARLAFKFSGVHNGTGTSSYTNVACGIDNIHVETLPNCARVTNLTVSGITNNSVTLNWNDTINTGATYTVYDMADTSVVATGINALTYTVTGLDANAPYTFGVVANCSATDEAAAATINTRTECDIFVISADNLLSESFESTTFPPDCWSQEHTAGTSTNKWIRNTSSTYVHTGSASAQLQDQQAGNKNNLVSPHLTIPQANAYQVSFWIYRNTSYASKTQEGVKVWVNTTPDTINGTPLMHIRRSTTQGEVTVDAAGWYQYSAAIPTSGNVYIIFEGISEYGASTYIDDVTIEELPSCARVTNLTVSGITNNSVTLNWNDTINTGATYTVYNMADTSVVATNVNALTYTVTGLTANTNYVFGVQANCSATDASGIVTIDAYTGYCTPNPTSVDGSGITTVTLGNITSAIHPTSAPYYIDNTDMIGNVPAGTTCTVGIEYSTGYTYGTIIWVDWNNNLTFDADEVVYRGTSTNTNPTILNATFDIPATTPTGAYRLRIAGADSFFDSYVDNPSSTPNPCFTSTYAVAEDYTLYVLAPPSCLAVTGLTVSNITSMGATLTWNASADAENGYWYFDAADSIAGMMTTDSTFAVLAGLEPQTTYTYGVISRCWTEQSDTVFVTFTTACAAVMLPLVEDFEETSATLACWSVADVASSTGIATSGAYSGSRAFRFAYNDNPPQYLISPELMAGWGDSVKVSFMYKVQTASYPESFQLGYSTTTADLTAFAWGTEQTNLVNTTYAAYSEMLPNTVKYVAVKYTADDQYYLYIDSLVIEDYVQCDAPVVTVDSVTSNSATISWTGTGSSYLYVAADNENVHMGDATTTSYTFTGLQPSTTYTYGVFAACGYGATSAIVPVTFTTAAVDTTGGDTTVVVNDTVHITIAVSDVTMGTTVPAPGTYNYFAGQTLSVTAVPATGYAYAGWIMGYAISGTVIYDTLDDIANDFNPFESDIDDFIGLGVYDFALMPYFVVAGGGDTTVVECNPVTLPWTETFDSTSTTRDCWDLVATGNIGGSNGMGFTTVDNREVLRFSSYSNASDYNQYGYSPHLSASASATALQVSVVYGTRTSDYLYFGYINGNDTVWDPTAYNTAGTNAAPNWQTYTAIVPATASKLAIHYYGNYQYYAWVDSVTVTELTSAYCYAVTGLTADSVTPTSVHLTWTDANNSGATYTVYNMADTSVIATGVATTSYEVTGLTALTGYTFGVMTNCTATDVSDIVTIDVLTACGGETCMIEINGADSYGDGWNGNAIQVMQAGNVIYTFTIETGNSASAHISVCSGTPVTFVWVAGSYASETSFEIKDGGGMVVHTVANGGSLTNGELIYTLTDACPSCVAAAITVDAVTTTSVTLNWTGSAASYDVYNGNTLVANVSTNTYTFTGLTPATSYTFGVQAICSATDSAALVTVNVMTSCADITTLPYTEGFENGLGCWTTVNGSADGQPWFTTDCAGLSTVAPHGGNYVASSWSWNSSAMHADAWMISPKFVLPTLTAGDTLNLSWWNVTNPNYRDHYSVMLSTTTNDTTAFTTTLMAYSEADTVWTQQVIDLSAYAGQSVYIAFHHVDYDENYLLVDDIALSMGAAPVPPAPLPDSMKVTVAVNDITMGTTVPAPGVHYFYEGEVPSVVAVPNTGYHLVGWTIYGTVNYPGYGLITLVDTTVSMAFPDVFTLLGDDTLDATCQYYEWAVTANFAAGEAPEMHDSVTVNVSVNDATMGVVNPAPGTHYYVLGDTVIMNITPNPGYRVVAVQMSATHPLAGILYDETVTDSLELAEIVGVDDTLIVEDEDMLGMVLNINVIFAAEGSEPNTYTVEVAYDPTMGTVTGADTYIEGANVTLRAIPAPNYQFYAWVENGDTVGRETIYTIANINASHFLTALFVPINSIEDVDLENVTIYSMDNVIVVRGAEGKQVVLFDVNGRMLSREARAAENVEFRVNNSGVYLVKVANAAAKRVVVIR